MPAPRNSLIAESTPTFNAVAQIVAEHYSLPAITGGALLRRGFNHVFELVCVDASKVVARLSGHRARGAPNAAYEAAMLAHLKAANAPVAAALPTKDGSACVGFALPEGERTLMLFEHLKGTPPGEDLADIEATGRALALIHQAGRGYQGPQSRYVLELPYLLDGAWLCLQSAPTLDAPLRQDFAAIAQQLRARIASMEGLTRVACHGDCHGSNNFMTDGPDGARIASFFDFDDAGPGWLAYDLSVFLWVMLLRSGDAEMPATTRERWSRFIAGYRSVSPIAAADFEAIAAFVSVRQFWLMGEYAGRLGMWGTEALPASYLRKQVKVLTAWMSLETPDAA